MDMHILGQPTEWMHTSALLQIRWMEMQRSSSVHPVLLMEILNQWMHHSLSKWMFVILIRVPTMFQKGVYFEYLLNIMDCQHLLMLMRMGMANMIKQFDLGRHMTAQWSIYYHTIRFQIWSIHNSAMFPIMESISNFFLDWAVVILIITIILYHL